MNSDSAKEIIVARLFPAITMLALLFACSAIAAQEKQEQETQKPAGKTVMGSMSNDMGDLGKLIFADHFQRNESQETSDQPGKGWKTNSKRRAEGNKQVDLKDGTLRITRHEVADHAVTVTHPAKFTDGSVEIKFMLENKEDSIGLDFADPQLKEVHAGHLFKATMATDFVDLKDLKTGLMDLKIRKLRAAKKLTQEQKSDLKTKNKRVNHQLETNKWYTALVNVSGSKLTLSIEGKEIASLSSPGIAHPTKKMLRLSVPKKPS